MGTFLGGAQGNFVASSALGKGIGGGRSSPSDYMNGTYYGSGVRNSALPSDAAHGGGVNTSGGTPANALGVSNLAGSNGSNGYSGLNPDMQAVLGIAQSNSAFNAAEAQKNRDWQERMSNTAHQREVADLLAAGINPVLTATGGNGAAVPGGAVAQADTSGTSAIAGMFNSILSSNAMLAAAQLASSATMYSADMGYKGAVAQSGIRALSNLVNGAARVAAML